MGQRFGVRHSPAFSWLLTLLGAPRRLSYVEVDGDRVSVRLSWMFRATFSRQAVTQATSRPDWHPISVGAHGWRGRWLVNGARSGIVVLDIDGRPRAWVTGIPVRLRQLAVSMDDPDAFLATVGAP